MVTGCQGACKTSPEMIEKMLEYPGPFRHLKKEIRYKTSDFVDKFIIKKIEEFPDVKENKIMTDEEYIEFLKKKLNA